MTHYNILEIGRMKQGPPDLIWLHGIECRSRLGVPAAERRRAQRILIDVGMELDLSWAGGRDDFKLTADYWGVEKAVRKAAETGERSLVEALAEQVAALVLKRERHVTAVTVRVHKRPALMPKTREVVVEIRRTRRD